MKIAIVFSTDPIIMNHFIYRIIHKGNIEIAAIIETKGAMIKKKKRIDRISNMLAIMLIVGFLRTIKYSLIVLYRKMFPSTSIRNLCFKRSIAYYYFNSINSNECVKVLTDLNPDIIFNQSDHIVKKRIIEIPKIGIVNRHGSLLPKYRGQMSPFWQLLNGETEGGISFHFLDEKIDNGPIIYQKSFQIDDNETVNSLIEKVFREAVYEFPKVIELLSKKDWKDHLIENDSKKATYYRLPKFKDAKKYRFGLRQSTKKEQ